MKYNIFRFSWDKFMVTAGVVSVGGCRLPLNPKIYDPNFTLVLFPADAATILISTWLRGLITSR